MNGSSYVWALMMMALAAAYLISMRNSGIAGSRLLKMGAIWVVIITGCYLIVSWITGVR